MVSLAFDGAQGFSIFDGEEITSDWVAYDVDETQPFLIEMHVPDLDSDGLATAVTQAGWTSYYRFGIWSSPVQTDTYTNYSATRQVLGVKKVEVRGATPSASMDLRSVGFTALADPVQARLVIDHEALDAVTLNTDILAYASRDGGTTWVPGPLVTVGTIGTHSILSALVDLADAPSGSTMKWRIETPTGKRQVVHDVALQWRS